MEKSPRPLIKKVIIWGLTLHSHTHSYIHYMFHRAFKYMGYDTLWLTHEDDISGIDFSNSLFLTCGICDQGIPVDPSCYYVLHNCEANKYAAVPPQQIIPLQVYTKHGAEIVVNLGDGAANGTKKHTFSRGPHNSTAVPDEFAFYGEGMLYQPWGTDLFPDEIDEEIKNLEKHEVKPESWFIGQPNDPWSAWEAVCRSHNVAFQSVGGFRNNVVSPEENKDMVQRSIIAPALQCDQQLEMGYLPCRIFKNISYGKMGVTNNPEVNKVFNNKLIYSDNLEELFNQAMAFERRPDKYDIIRDLMIEVRDKHTYINRVNSIMWMLSKTDQDAPS